MRIDLYLGGDLGLWALGNAPASRIAQVITTDTEIASRAQDLGIRVEVGNANRTVSNCAPVGLSIHYPRILRRDLLKRYLRVYNLHPGYLPWGRGYYPVFWAMWEGHPAGATLHQISEGIDEGPIVAQTQVAYTSADTGYSLFCRVRDAEKTLFSSYWDRIVHGEELPTFPQSPGGSYHAKGEFFELKRGSSWQKLSACELVKLARCLTFPGYTGLEIELGGELYSLLLRPLSCKR